MRENTLSTCARSGARRALLVGGLAAVCVAAVPAAAFAATGTGTSSLTVTPGSLSIGTTTPETITGPIGGTGTGILPAATWSDTTGSGSGWHGTVAVSDLTLTGKWTQTAGTATSLATSTSTSASTYTGTADGVEYTVTVTSSGTTTSTPYKWTSNSAVATNAIGSGTATNGTAETIGTLGVKIDFASGTTYPATAEYEIKVGTQKPTAFTLDSAATGAGVMAGATTTTPAPTLLTTATTLSGNATAVATLGAAVTFLEATAGNGMGTYAVKPGVKVQTDPNTWAATYKAKVQYSIVTGP